LDRNIYDKFDIMNRYNYQNNNTFKNIYDNMILYNIILYYK